MGMFDDALKNAVPGGNLATPIAVAVGALILGKLFGGGWLRAGAVPLLRRQIPTNAPSTSVIGGLSDLIGKLTAGRRPAGQFLGRPWPKTSRSSPDSSAARSAERAERSVAAHRHEPAGTAATSSRPCCRSLSTI